VTVGERTLVSELLVDYDVVILPASSGTVEYLPEEIVAIKDYLNEGGGVLLCNPGSMPSTPATKLLMSLGIPTLRFSINRAEGELIDAAGNSLGVQAVGNTINILSNVFEDGFTVGAFDSNHRPVLIQGTISNGRIAMVSEEAVLFTNNGRKFSPGARELLDWLGGNRIGKAQGAVEERLYPEATLQHGNITVYYSDVLKEHVDLIVEHADEILEFIEECHGHSLSEMRVVLLACAGSGYAAGGEIGVGVLGDKTNVIEVMGHELTHEWVRPAILPSTMNEAWAIIMGLRVARIAGFEEHWASETARLEAAYNTAKEQLLDMDLRLAKEETGQHWFGYIGKTLHLVQTAEEMYGEDFSKEFFTLAIKRIKEGSANSPLTLKDIAVVVGDILCVEPDLVYQRLSSGQ